MPISFNSLKDLQSEGIQRAESQPAFGRWAAQPKTDKEKEEEERRKSSGVAGFFNTALDWYDKVDFSVADKLGLVDKIPEWKGPVDEILRAGLREGTRISTPLIALGGIGLAGKLGSTAARAGARAAASQGARKVGFRGLQAGAKTGQMLTEPIASAKNISMPVRFAAETGMVAGAGMAARGMQETIPDTAPTAFKVGAPLLVGLAGGLGGARTTMAAMRKAGIKVDNALKQREVAEAVAETQRRSSLKQSVGKHLTKAEEEQALASGALADEFTGFQQQDRVDTIQGKGKQRKEVVTGRYTSADDIIRDAYRADYDANMPRRASDQERFSDPYEELVTMTEQNKYPVRQIDEVTGEATVQWRDWDDTPAFLDGQKTGALMANAFEMRAMAAAGYASKEDQYMNFLLKGGKNNEYKVEIDDKMRSLNDLLEDSKLSVKVKDELLTLDKTTGLYRWTAKGKPFEAAINKIRDELDIQLEAEKQAGIDISEITGETLGDIPQEVITEMGRRWDAGEMPFFGDIIERTGEARGYFPRFVAEGFEGIDGQPRDAVSRSFGNRSFEKERKAGFAEGAEYQRQMWEVAEGRGRNQGGVEDITWQDVEVGSDEYRRRIANAAQFYMSPRQALSLRFKSGMDRINAQWFKDELAGGIQGVGGETVLQRLELNPEWGQARRNYIDSRDKVSRIKKTLFEGARYARFVKNLSEVKESTLRAAHSRLNGVLNSQTDQMINLHAQLDQLRRDFTTLSRQRGKTRKEFRGESTRRVKDGPPRMVDGQLKQVYKTVKVARPNALRMKLIKNAIRNLEGYLDGKNNNYQKIRENPKKAMEALEEANKQVNLGINQMSNNLKRFPARASELIEGSEPPRTRAHQLSEQANKIQREQLASDQSMSDSLGELFKELKRIDDFKGLRFARADVDALEVELATAKGELSEARTLYEKALEQAKHPTQQQLKRQTSIPDGEGGFIEESFLVSNQTGQINNFAFSGRTFEKGFADEINKYLEMSDRNGLGAVVRNFNNFARPLMATLDLSAIGIQGLLAIGMDPIRSAQMIAYSSRAMFNPAFYDRFIVDNYTLIDDFIKGGGYWAPLDDAGEFMFKGGVAKVPAFGKLAQFSNHHFSRTGNLLRLQMYKNAMQNTGALTKLGLKGQMKDKDIRTREDMIQSINEATGFKAGVPSELGTALFFAPRYFGSQLSLLKKAAYKDGPDGAYARDMIARTLATMSLATWFFNTMQDEETDWSPIRYDMEGNPHWDSNFMRIKHGGQDISLFGSWDSLLALLGTTVTEGPVSSATRLGRTKASPAMARMFDIITGETFTGDRVELMSDDPRVLGMAFWNLLKQQAPFTVQDMLGDVAQGPDFQLTDVGTWTRPSALGLASNVTGIKAAPQTPYERRDVRSQEIWGRNWEELTPSEKTDVRNKYPEIMEAIDHRNQLLADRGDIDATLRVNATKAEASAIAEARELALGVESGNIPREEFASRFRDIRHDLAVTKQAMFDAAGTKFVDSEDPVLRAVGEYYDIINDPAMMIGGRRDWNRIDDRLDSLKLKLAPENRKRFDEFFALNYGQWPEEIHTFMEMDHAINESAYWDLKEEAFNGRTKYIDKIVADAGIEPITNYDELIRAINTATTRALSNRLDVQLKIIDRKTGKAREKLRRNDPDLDIALFITRGYKPVTLQGRLVQRSKRRF